MLRRAATAAVVAAVIAAGWWLWTPDKTRAELESKYLRSARDYLEVDGLRLHVRDDGPRAARALILLHGIGSSLQTWEPWAQLLKADYRVVRFDLPGSGLSAPDPSGDYSDARSLQLLSALMDQLGIDRATLIGNSIGGRIAWKFAARYPQRVERLVLISPDGFASPGFEYGRRPQVPVVLNVMKYILPKALLRMNLAPAYGDASRLTAPVVARYFDLLLAPGARNAMLSRMRQSVMEDPLPSLRSIQAPTLLLWGEKDGMIPFTNAVDYLHNLPHASLVSFPSVGHVPQEEAPDESVMPLKSFLRDASSPREWH